MFRDGQLILVQGELLEQGGDIEMKEPVEEDRLAWDTDEGTELLLVPEDMWAQLVKEHHDAMAAGHWGVARTMELISRNYWWPNLRTTVEEYIARCERCQRAKPDRHARQTALKPMPVRNGPWQEIAKDFVVGLPDSDGFNAILMVVDRFSKTAR